MTVAGATSPAPPAEPITPAMRLLIVEDDLPSARLLREILEAPESGAFSVQHASTLTAACEIVERREADVVLLDLGLPDARDLEAFHRLQNCVTEIPIIILTGNGDEQIALEALQRGAEDYLHKGQVNRDSLVRSIRYSIERHRSVRDLARIKSELEIANQDLERLTLLDPLTELLNRRGLQRALSREVERLNRVDEGTAALMIDLDDFRRVNLTFGHSVGDVVLKEISRRLKAAVRAVDYVGRLGGDEFLMLLPSADVAEVARIADRIRLTVATTVIQHDSQQLAVTASVGVLMISTEMPSIDHLLARMHELLRRGKNEGKNRVVFEAMSFEDTAQRLRAQADMCNRLARGTHLLTVRQPIVRIDDETAVGYEFLNRYQSDTIEMPDQFFRVCSERNILTLVDHHCLRRSIGAASLLDGKYRVHVNIFPATLLSIPSEHVLQSFPDPLPAETFCLEISEQQIIGDPSYLKPALSDLRSAGVQIAIDDVGFGSSCLESLVMLEPEVVKIDKRCVIGVSSDAERRRHLGRYVALAESLGAELVAEGVETPEDLTVLRDLGIRYAQGFYWGRPEAAA